LNLLIDPVMDLKGSERSDPSGSSSKMPQKGPPKKVIFIKPTLVDILMYQRQYPNIESTSRFYSVSISQLWINFE